MAQKVLRVGILTPIRTLNPRETRELVSTQAAAQIYEAPYAPPKGEGSAFPVLFDPIETNSPGVMSAAVRAGIVFSDGTPLTAALAVQSLTKADPIKSQGTVEARGDRVVFTLKSPNPRFDLTLTLHQCAITLDKGGALLGTGPYVAAPGSSLSALRLLRNDKWRGKAQIDEIEFKVFPPNADGKPEALMKALAEGEVDVTTMLSRTDAGAVSGVRKLFQPSNSTSVLFFNTEKPELVSPVTRQALARAVNRLALAEISYTNALAFAASGLLPPALGQYRDDLSFDLDKARALLAQAPAPRPTRLKLVPVWAPRPYLPNPQPVAELVSRQLGVLGLDVTIRSPTSSDEFYRLAGRGDYDLLLGGWIADTPDPADFLEAVLRSDRIQTTDMSGLPTANRSRLRNADMDAALRRFREDPSSGSRLAIQKLLDDLAPLVPLMYGPSVIVNSWKVKNLEASALGIPHFADADIGS